MSRALSLPACTESLTQINVCKQHSHHCAECGAPSEAGGHFVGGYRADARTICDPTDRAAYLASVAATTGRRYGDEGGV